MLEKNQEKVEKRLSSIKIWSIYLTILVIIGGAVLAGLVLDKLLKGTSGGGIEINTHKVEALKSFLGAEVMELNEIIKEQLSISADQGALINAIIDDSPADEAGLQRGDVIMRLDREMVGDVAHLQELLDETSPGDVIKIVVERAQYARTFFVKLEETPGASSSVALTQGQPQDQTQGQTPAQQGWGMGVSPLDSDMAQKYGLEQGQSGVIVTNVIPSGGASIAGIQVGDIILAANNQPTEELPQFYTAIAGSQNAVLDIFRAGQTSYVLVQADPLQPPSASLGMTTALTAGNPNETDDEGYKGMPPVIPPKGEYDPDTMGSRTTAGTTGTLNRVDVCICPLCGATITHPAGVPCSQMNCPVCGSRLINATPGIAAAYDNTITPKQTDPQQQDPQRPSYAGAAKGQRDLDPVSLTGGSSSDDDDEEEHKPSTIPPMGTPGDGANVINIWQIAGQPTAGQPTAGQLTAQPLDIPPSMGGKTTAGQPTGGQLTAQPLDIPPSMGKTTAGTVNRVQVCICPVCGTTVGHPAGVPCSSLNCPYCGNRMIPADTDANSSTQQGNRPPTTGQGMAQGGSTGGSTGGITGGTTDGTTGYGSSGSGGPGGECVCPSCGTLVPHTASLPCYEMKCPKCGTPMVRAIPGVTVNVQLSNFLQIADQKKIITSEDLKEKIDSGEPFILIDVRSKSDYNAGHIPGAISMPINEISDRYVVLSQNWEIIIYCQIGKSCQDAADMLLRLGFTDVTILTGGVNAWDYGLVTTPMGYTTSGKPDTIPPDMGQQTMTTAVILSQKIAISSKGRILSSQIAPLFDRAPYFIIVGPGTFQAYRNPNANDSKDVGIQSAQFVVDKGADVVITDNISLEAMKELRRLNVKVYSGTSGTVSKALEWYMDGRLNETTVGTSKGDSGSDEEEGKAKEKKGRDAEKASLIL